jgi:RNA polymerase sigma-70 factor (ECF subfamily)
MHQILKHLRKVLTPNAAGGSTDWELLERFAVARDESAFEVLLWRHHRMVLSVCSRILADSNDVEDAFQASFLVLARKAKTIQRSGSLSSWLYGVARRVALEGCRSSPILQPALLPPESQGPDPCDELIRRELRGVFDMELGRLPEKYRAPVVLCYLEGMTYEQAGQQLGCSRGTVSTRLTRARELLRVRLTNRGLALPVGVLAAWLCEQAASAATPVPLVVNTCKAALLLSAGKPVAAALSPKVAALCEGVIQAMFVTKLKIAAAVLCVVAMLGAGVGAWLGGNSTLAAATESVENETPVTPPQKGQRKSDHEAIQGTWKVVSCELGGQKVDTEDFSMVITGDKIVIKDEGSTKQFTYTLDPDKKPKHIDWVPAFGVNKGNIVQGIYRLNGDNLVFCTNGSQETSRPSEFKTMAGRQVSLLVLQRDKPPQGGDRSSKGPVLNELLDDLAFAARWEKRWLDEIAEQPKRPEFDMGKWEVDLNEVHRNPRFKETCILCHQQKNVHKAPDLDKLIIKQFGDLALIRLPKKKGRAADAEFLRRLCLDVLGRTPTPLEMHYFLRDTDPEKHRRVAERLLMQEGSPFVLFKVKPQADRLTRAEEYIKKQLGKKQLSPAERRLMQMMLEFADREQTRHPDRADVLRMWMEFFSTPAAEPRKLEKR